SLLSHRTGTSPLPEEEHATLLLVEEDGWLTGTLTPLLPKPFVVTTVTGGGAALDSASDRQFDIAVVKDTLPDLPGRMVVKTMAARPPAPLVLLSVPPTLRKPGRMGRVEDRRIVPLLAEFSNVSELATKLGELHKDQLARRRERRYLAEFRAENVDLLRRF